MKMTGALLVLVCPLIWQCYSASVGNSHGLQYRQNAANTTDDGTGVLSAGVVAAFSIIGVIAALVGIVTPLIGLIFKVALMIHKRHQNNSRKDDGNQTLGEDSKNHQNTSNKENNSREDNGNQTLGEGNDDSAHVLVHHGDQQNYHAGAAFQGVPLPTIDPHLPGIPRINEMQVSATYIHQIARCQDDQSLQSLTCKKLSEKIKKWEDKQRAEAKPRPRPKKGSENENDNPPAGTSVGRQETSTESLKKEVQDYYKKEHPDMTVQKKNKFLVAKEGLIKGKPQYLLKHNNSAAEPDGLLHIVVVKSIEPELKENDEKYHQIQTLLYAGGLVYCDYVQCSKTGDAQPAIQRILPQEDWQKTVVPKAHKYCKYFDEMWSQVKSQHHKNQLLQDM